MSALSDLDFQNLILEPDIEKARFRRGKANGNTLVPPKDSEKDDLKRLYDQTHEKWARNKAEPDFTIEYDKIRFRCSVITDNVFVYRRMLDTIPSLAACGLHHKIIKYILEIKSGMVLFVGEFSSGKPQQRLLTLLNMSGRMADWRLRSKTLASFQQVVIMGLGEFTSSP